VPSQRRLGALEEQLSKALLLQTTCGGNVEDLLPVRPKGIELFVGFSIDQDLNTHVLVGCIELDDHPGNVEGNNIWLGAVGILRECLATGHPH
jgi:hypothetical protein